jgi:hypothetical protein
MSKEQIEAKRRYDGEFQKDKVADKVGRNKARKKLGLKPGNPNDASHTKNGVVAKHKSKNRGSKSDMPGDKRARGGKHLLVSV